MCRQAEVLLQVITITFKSDDKAINIEDKIHVSTFSDDGVQPH